MGDRMCDFVIKLTPADLTVRPARTLSEVKNAFKLIYKEYIPLGYCDPNEAKMHYSPYSLLPTSRTFVLKKKRIFLGTISLIADSPCGLPMESAFPDIINDFRRRNKKLAEVSLLTIDRKAFRRKKLELTDHHKLTGSFWLFKAMLDYARHVAGITDLFITIHPRHEKLYQNFAFKPIGEAVAYDYAKGNPGLPMHLDISRLEEHLPDGKSFRNFFFENKSSAETLTQSYEWSSDILHELLSKKQDSWGEMSSRFTEYFQTEFLQNLPGTAVNQN